MEPATTAIIVSASVAVQLLCNRDVSARAHDSVRFWGSGKGQGIEEQTYHGHKGLENWSQQWMLLQAGQKLPNLPVHRGHGMWRVKIINAGERVTWSRASFIFFFARLSRLSIARSSLTSALSDQP